MIEFLSGNPTEEEIAAIAAALRLLCHPEQSERSERRRGTAEIWGIAGRYPDLEIEDLRAALRQPFDRLRTSAQGDR